MRPRTLVLAALFSALVLPALTRGDEEQSALARAVTQLMHGDADARREAHETLAAAGADALPAVLRLVEELRAAAAAASQPPGFEEIGLAPAARVPAPEPVEGDGPIIQLYDVRDLLATVDSAESLLEELRGAAGAGLETLQQASPGTLVVKASAAVHERIRRQLVERRDAASELIQIDTRFLLAPRTTSLGIGLATARPGDVLLQTEVAERVAAWVGEGAVEIVSAPRLSALDGQTANITIGRQISYVEDFDVEVAESGLIADPIVNTLFVGSALDLVARFTHSDSIRVDLTLSQSELREPIKTVKIELHGSPVPVEIQAPETFETRMRRLVLLEDGGEALIAAPGTPDAHRLLFISVQRVGPPETEER